MTETIFVEYGRIEKSIDVYFVSSSGTFVDPETLLTPVEYVVSWDNLSADVIDELMVWENASDQDFRYLDGLTE